MYRVDHWCHRRILRHLLSSLVFACWAVPAFSCELDTPLDVTEVRPGVYVHEGVHEDISARNCGDIANVGFIVGEASVAVIDPGGSPSIGLRLRKAVELVTPLPISHLVITHSHPDHFFGANQIGSNVTVVAHKNYSRALAQRGRFYIERFSALFSDTEEIELVRPTVQVEAQELINLGGRELRLIAHKTAHTDNDLSVFDVESGVLWAGDLLFHDRIPSLDGSVSGWLDVMDELAQSAPEVVVPGHGPVGLWEDIAPKQRQYLQVLQSEIRDVISANGRLSQAIDDIGADEREKWLLFDDYHQGNVTKAFTELEWE